MQLMYYNGIAKKYNISLDTPFKDLPKEAADAFLYGTKDRLELQIIDSFGGGVRYSKFEGIINNLERRYKESSSEYSKSEIADCMNEINCPECKGERLKRKVFL